MSKKNKEAKAKSEKPFIRVSTDVNDVAFGDLPNQGNFIVESDGYESEVFVKTDMFMKHDKKSVLNAAGLGSTGNIRPFTFNDDVRVIPVKITQIRVKRIKV